MIHITAKHRYQVGSETVLFVTDKRMANFDEIANGAEFTWSARNENNGVHAKSIGRSICRATKIEERPNGYYIYAELDIEYLPITRRLKFESPYI